MFQRKVAEWMGSVGGFLPEGGINADGPGNSGENRPIFSPMWGLGMRFFHAPYWEAWLDQSGKF